MSIDCEVDVYVSCDLCGKTVDDDNCTVLCRSCASETGSNVYAYEYCSPVPIQGKYTCTGTCRDFEWDGELPEFCPRCGRMIRA